MAVGLKLAVGHLKRSKVRLYGQNGLMELPMLQDCPVHRFRFLPKHLLVACVDGTARVVHLRTQEQLVLGEPWNGVAPTGARWRNCFRGAVDVQQVAGRWVVTWRHRDMEQGDAMVVYGRHFEGSNYRRLLLSRSLEADITSANAALARALDFDVQCIKN